MKILCLGDSLTTGYGVSRNESWCFVLQSISGIHVINGGVNGDTSIGLLTRSSSDIDSVKPDAVIIFIGTNDMIMNRSVSNTSENIILVIEDIQSSNLLPIVAFPPKIIPQMASKLWDSNVDYLTVNKKIYELREMLKDYCSINSINTLDYYDLFSENTEIPSRYYLDGIHLNSSGHKRIAVFTFERIKQCCFNV
ncbi:GDSL-type esterase/lipase family protein [Clostridium polynesiense]|uniref:GDSL-type esterase/lipase family protein n=1 Tax=Clostridium polynesiense TaxID=1325933 RepID=UPI000693E949|nr:GDSL-type esterase/lipase family protein [Clostridium polynesiense]